MVKKELIIMPVLQGGAEVKYMNIKRSSENMIPNGGGELLQI